jgi:hypothetical protein
LGWKIHVGEWGKFPLPALTAPTPTSELPVPYLSNCTYPALTLNCTLPHTVNMSASIDSETLKQYLADNPPSVVPLTIKPHFDALTNQEKLYAHHISM